MAIAVFALRGIYFALLEESRVPVAVTGTAVGLVSMVGFTPDVFAFPLAGWLVDSAGAADGLRVYFTVLSAAAVAGLLLTVALASAGRKQSSSGSRYNGSLKMWNHDSPRLRRSGLQSMIQPACRKMAIKLTQLGVHSVRATAASSWTADHTGGILYIGWGSRVVCRPCGPVWRRCCRAIRAAHGLGSREPGLVIHRYGKRPFDLPAGARGESLRAYSPRRCRQSSRLFQSHLVHHAVCRRYRHYPHVLGRGRTDFTFCSTAFYRA